MRLTVWTSVCTFLCTLNSVPLLLIPYIAEDYSHADFSDWRPLFRLLSTLYLLVPATLRLAELKYRKRLLLRLVLAIQSAGGYLFALCITVFTVLFATSAAASRIAHIGGFDSAVLDRASCDVENTQVSGNSSEWSAALYCLGLALTLPADAAALLSVTAEDENPQVGNERLKGKGSVRITEPVVTDVNTPRASSHLVKHDGTDEHRHSFEVTDASPGFPSPSPKRQSVANAPLQRKRTIALGPKKIGF